MAVTMTIFKLLMELDLQTRHHYIAVDPELLGRLRKQAQARGITVESLANLWIREWVLAFQN